MSSIENGDKIKLHERLARVETQVETILTNHLPHIEKKMGRVMNMLWAILVILIGALVGFIADLMGKL